MPCQESGFPDPESADDTGLVAVTPDLDVDLLLDAYHHGLFPWSEDPVCWYSPDPRAVFLPGRVHLPRRLLRLVRQRSFTVTCDTAFERVMRACAHAHRHQGTWIGEGFVRAYTELHQRGFAHSVEVWRGDELAGGLYGVHIGGFFAGESMFHAVSNASKVAFVHLLVRLNTWGNLFIDAQVINRHTAELGAVLVHRRDYLWLLRKALETPCRYSGERWPRAGV